MIVLFSLATHFYIINFYDSNRPQYMDKVDTCKKKHIRPLHNKDVHISNIVHFFLQLCF
jgi:hypothetical protein